MSEFFGSLFGDPDYVQRLESDARNENSLAAGDGKHFVVAWIGDQGMETDLACEWDPKDDKAPCYDPGLGPGCKIKYSWDNIGSDMMEKSPERDLLKVKFPIGYRTEGHNDDFEDWVYSVRPTVDAELDAAMADLPEGTEPRSQQILDPETGTVHGPHVQVDIDGKVTFND